MRLFSGLLIGRESLIANGTALGTSADNLANLNTTAFKTQRPDFSSIVAQNLGGLYSMKESTGNGVQVPEISILHSQQGNLDQTGRDLDFGINGAGFFILNDGTQNFYSRDGNFSTDADGNLVTDAGKSVMGYLPGAPETLVPLTLGDIASTATPTSSVKSTGNLDASTPLNTNTGEPTTFKQLNDFSDFSAPLDIVDSLGQKHSIALHFFHTENLTWRVAAYADALETGGTASAPDSLGEGTLTFDQTGISTAAEGTPTFTFTPAWSNGSAATPVAVDMSGFTGFASSSTINSIVQDGIVPGNIVGYSVEPNGEIFARLDNGTSISAGTIALSAFINTDGLTRIGNNEYYATEDAGEPAIGNPLTDNRGEVRNAVLEGSTVDPANEFVDVIRYQRAYQAGSQVIKTTDEMLTTTIQLA